MSPFWRAIQPVAVLILLWQWRVVRGGPGQCQVAPQWTVDGRHVMRENTGNVTLLALMQLQCSFCRSQIEGLVSLSKMLRNQSISRVQFVLVAGANESSQFVSYFRAYLSPHNITVVQESPDEPVWSLLNGNKDDFFLYDACGRLNYHIPYPQSYLYYHYTVSSLYSTLRQDKCGPCRYIASLASTTPSSKADCDQDRLQWQLLVKIRAYLNVMGANATTQSTRTVQGGATETTISTASTASGTSTTSTIGTTSTSTADLEGTATVVPTPLMVSVVSEEDEYEYEEEDTEDSATVGPVQQNHPNTSTTSPITSTSPATSTTVTTGQPSSVQPSSVQPQSTTLDASESTRVPKLSDNVDCSSYSTAQCYRQWQEFGTLHSCCQRGVYLTDLCRAPLCTNSTFQLCCFQKYQQARFQCCHDHSLSSDQPDDFSRCCYQHFVHDDDGNGDGDDQCCPRAVASYFWISQTRVAELCLPNVELDLEGIVLEARMADKSAVRIPLHQSTALQYQCPYANKREQFFYWEPDTADPSTDTN